MYQTNILADLIAAIVFFLLGFAWYTVFGKAWMKSLNMSKDSTSKDGMGSKMIMAFISAFVTMVITSFLINIIGIYTIGEWLVFGILLWIGLMVVIYLDNVLWENKSTNWFWISIFGKLIPYLLAGMVLIWFQ